jgi:hypothetical protein
VGEALAFHGVYLNVSWITGLTELPISRSGAGLSRDKQPADHADCLSKQTDQASANDASQPELDSSRPMPLDCILK